MELFGPGHRALAWVLGWMTHVTGDGLIKAVLDGINLHLIDGKYTATNRPVQDLVTFNEIGREELGLNWASLLDDLATTPVSRCSATTCRYFSGKAGWVPILRVIGTPDWKRFSLRS